MLIFTRKKGQAFIIDGDIKITYLGDNQGHARLGIEAPREISVHREEVQKNIDAGLPSKKSIKSKEAE